MVGALDVTEQTDEQLAAEAAREGSDGPAFTALVGRHQDRVWRICFRLMGNEHDASDAAQEVFVSLFLHRAEFAGRARFATWLHSVAMRTCLGLRRARGRRQRREAAVAAQRTEAAAPDHAAGLATDLARMLETLNEEDRALLILKYAEGYSFDELAEIFECSASACKMRASRAREELQRRYPDQNI